MSTDNAGRQILPGQKVVYNWSGQLAIGKLEAIKEKYIIRRLQPIPRLGEKPISKVRSARNIMVIE